MTTEQVYICDGWTVRFYKNIHMYSHSLKLSKNGEIYAVFCEDSPFGFVGIWPYVLEVSNAKFREILVVLNKWASQSALTYRLYTSPKEYEADVAKLWGA